MAIRGLFTMGKAFFVFAHLILLTLFSFLMADLIGLFIGERLVVYSKIPESPLPAPTKSLLKTSQEYSKVIVEGNIFNAKQRGQPPGGVITVPEPQAVLELTPLKIRLMGTVVGSGSEDTFAIIEDQTTKEQVLYHLNDLVAQEAQLVKVERGAATLLRGGRSEILPLYEEEGQNGPPVPSIPPAGGVASGVHPVSTNRWVLDKREISQAFDDLPQLLTKARIIPNFTGGQADGVRMISIVPSSLYERIGLRNGDIL